jgi:ribosomal protein S3
MIEVKPLLGIIGISVLLINGMQTEKAPEYECKINIDSLEKALDSTLIHQSVILGSTALKKDSTAKVLTKVCNVLKTEVNVLKIENKDLKSDLQVLSKKAPDTILKTVYIKKGIFGGVDTLND